MPWTLLVMSFGFLALISMPMHRPPLFRWFTRLASSISFSARPSISSANHIFVIALPLTETMSSWSSKASYIILSRKTLKRVGERRYPYRTPTEVKNQSPLLPFKMTALVVLSYSCSITQTKLALMLYFQAACHTLSKAFLKSTKTWCR